MIGEKMVLGQFKSTIDDKGRFNVPVKTGRETNEEVIATYNYDEDVIELYSKNNYIRMIQDVADSTDLDYIMLHRNTLLLYKDLLNRALFESFVDQQGRMWADFDVLKRYGFVKKSKIYLLGQGNYLEMYPNEEKLELQLKKRKLIK